MVKKFFQAAHLELRHKTYFAVLYVPADIRHIIGKTKFTRSTRTGDQKIAEQRAAAYAIGWKAEISRARHVAPDPMVAEAMDLLMNAQRRDLVPGTLEEIIDARIDEISATNPYAAKEFAAIASGKSKHLSSLISGWIANLHALGLKQKTIDQMERDIPLLTDAFRTADLLDKRTAYLWIQQISSSKAFTASTVIRVVGTSKNFFRYLQSIDEIPRDTVNPFVVPDEYVKSKKRSTRESNRTVPWVPFLESDVILLRKDALKRNDQILADLILIGAYTGARIEEICSLKCAVISLENASLRITDAKTEAGIRVVPIHSKIRDRIAKLLEESTDGYLLSGLTFNKYGDRSNAIGKRFGRMKTELAYGRSHVFHSIRKTLVTKLENAGVSENLAADIVGHEKPRITFGLYSDGAFLEVMRKAIEQISYDFEGAPPKIRNSVTKKVPPLSSSRK